MSFSAMQLKPSAGFVVKSTTLQDAFYATKSKPASSTLLEPSSNGLAIPKGLKVFVNIAWDANVPPPPEGSEDVIQKAMLGEDLDDLNPEGWYVPTVVSDGRQDTDKAGKMSLVFDAVFHSSLKSRTLKDPEFKTFLIELAFQRIEAQTSGAVTLSRQIGTPNIASKGKLEPRTVHIPSVLFSEGHPNRSTLPDKAPGKGKKLIEEVESATEMAKGKGKGKAKGILKPAPTPTAPEGPVIPSWTWTKTPTKIKIVINVPLITRAHITDATLDLEPRRLILSISPLYALDVPLDAPDAELVAVFARAQSEQAALTLKRERDLDVEEARAEWRVEEGCLVVYA